MSSTAKVGVILLRIPANVTARSSATKSGSLAVAVSARGNALAAGRGS
jgi:hypothetical protein